MEKKWHVVIGGKQQGPFADLAIQNMLKNGRINDNTLVWCQGMENWKLLKEIPGFFQQEVAVPVQTEEVVLPPLEKVFGEIPSPTEKQTQTEHDEQPKSEGSKEEPTNYPAQTTEGDVEPKQVSSKKKIIIWAIAILAGFFIFRSCFNGSGGKYESVDEAVKSLEGKSGTCPSFFKVVNIKKYEEQDPKYNDLPLDIISYYDNLLIDGIYMEFLENFNQENCNKMASNIKSFDNCHKMFISDFKTGRTFCKISSSDSVEIDICQEFYDSEYSNYFDDISGLKNDYKVDCN